MKNPHFLFSSIFCDRRFLEVNRFSFIFYFPQSLIAGTWKEIGNFVSNKPPAFYLLKYLTIVRYFSKLVIFISMYF